MLFSSTLFLFIFLPSVLAIYYGVLKKRKERNIFLLLASLVFYGWGEPKYVFLMLGCIGMDYIGGVLIDKYKEEPQKAKWILRGLVTLNLGIMGVFKYVGFGLENLNNLLNLQIEIPNIILPIGISFFTFQSISYLVDVYRGKGEVLRNPLDVGLYIALFPQLVAGPIVRYEVICDELNYRQETEKEFAEGVLRFIKGLGGKVILANNFALIADKAFGLSEGQIAIGFAWMGAVAYMLQIYFDFAGYSDMAIGLGKMFGFHFEENFKEPYLAKSISEFWRRWHISLGSWFRDYVYFPLGGSRVSSKMKLVRNLLVVWMLTGLWHGANWTFVIWGLYFGIIILLEKICHLEKYLIKSKVISHIYVCTLVLFGWVIFRAESIGHGISYIQSMFGLHSEIVLGSLGNLYLCENKYLFLVGILCCLPLQNGFKGKFKRLQGIRLVGSLLILLTTLAYLIKGSYNPFIYFNF